MALLSMQHSTKRQSNRVYDPWGIGPQDDSQPNSKVYQAQATIYTIFIELAKTWASDDVISLFQQVFIHCVDSSESNLVPAIYTILSRGSEEDFHYTLNRVCYILINNWESARTPDAILDLMDSLATASEASAGTSSQLRTLRQWLDTFLQSKSFKDLQLYASRYTRSTHWTHRYTSYLLASQSLNQNNPDEQRSVANAASGAMKRAFKRDLAMYTIQVDRPKKSDRPSSNPTLLGEHVVSLIKKILTNKGEFSGQNLANRFLTQAKNTTFKHCKQGLLEYLLLSMGSNEMITVLKEELRQHLGTLYTHYDERPTDDAILLRTANQVIDFFTIDRRGTPAAMMTLLLHKGYALTLVIFLLKVIMISPKSRIYLEGKIGDLVTHYSELPETECEWLIRFLEIVTVTFTIYSEQSAITNQAPAS